MIGIPSFPFGALNGLFSGAFAVSFREGKGEGLLVDQVVALVRKGWYSNHPFSGVSTRWLRFREKKCLKHGETAVSELKDLISNIAAECYPWKGQTEMNK